jgi:hypothetical protein
MSKRIISYEDGIIKYFSGEIDEFGNPVKRCKSEYPYSYDGFVTYRNGENSEANCTIYSDRMIREKEYEELSTRHFGGGGQMFFNRSGKKIEKFLRDWFDDPELKLIFVMEYCNVSNGYPLWRFDFRKTPGGGK